jgi:hypothetical protein
LRIALGLTCLLFVSLAGLPATAQDAVVSYSARVLFQQGLKHVDAQEWGEAESSFREALLLRDSPVIRFNLAVTLLELGQLREATEQLKRVDADVGAPADVRSKIPDLLQSAEKRSARLTIRVAGETAQAQVLLDERALSASALGSVQLVDPGDHLVRLLRGRDEVERQQLSLNEGDERRLVLTMPAPVLPAIALPVAAAPAPAVVHAAPQPAPASHDDLDDETRRRRRWWGYGTAAVALTAGAVAGALLATRSHDKHDYPGDFSPKVIGVRVPQ